MNGKYLYLLVLLISLLFGQMAHSAERDSLSNKQLFSRLDEIIESEDSVRMGQTARVETFMKWKASALSKEELYWINKSLFDEYIRYNSDSAIVYAERNLEIAKEILDKDAIELWTLNRLYIYVSAGLFNTAFDLIKQIDESSLTIG